MKVKVGDTIYDSEDQPVMVILTDTDKHNIATMSSKATRYCMYPTTGMTPDELLAWMRDDGNA